MSLLAIVALGLPLATAWISTSQARHGLTIAHIRNESLGLTDGVPHYSFGYLWSQPGTTDLSNGLGASITWAWDQRLCDAPMRSTSFTRLKVEENFWGLPLVSCASIKASMSRAFATWSDNSVHIKFTDVSGQCAELGYTETRCPLAEIWVTSFDGLNDAVPADHVSPTVSVGEARFTSFFRGTNAVYSYRLLGEGASAVRTPRQVAETVGGTLAFRTVDTCWYLDSGFCSSFHRWKRVWDGPSAAYAVGVTLFFTFWLSIAMLTCCFTCWGSFVALRNHNNYRVETMYELSNEKLAPMPVCEGVFAIIASFSVTGLALRIMLLIVVWPMYTAMFSTCWSCYDFEAGAAHEIGHLLGLAHPELAPYEVLGGYHPTGENSYHEALSAGEAFNASSCLSPWAGVRSGVPNGAATDSAYTLVDVRPSIMFDFGLDNPRICLEQDDLEALNVLYPDCTGGPTKPLCMKPPLNLGWLRVTLTLMAFGVALAFAALLQLYAWCMLRYYQREERTSRAMPTPPAPTPTASKAAPLPALPAPTTPSMPATPAKVKNEI